MTAQPQPQPSIHWMGGGVTIPSIRSRHVCGVDELVTGMVTYPRKGECVERRSVLLGGVASGTRLFLLQVLWDPQCLPG